MLYKNTLQATMFAKPYTRTSKNGKEYKVTEAYSNILTDTNDSNNIGIKNILDKGVSEGHTVVKIRLKEYVKDHETRYAMEFSTFKGEEQKAKKEPLAVGDTLDDSGNVIKKKIA